MPRNFFDPTPELGGRQKTSEYDRQGTEISKKHQTLTQKTAV
jgi:hypothetical protein